MKRIVLITAAIAMAISMAAVDRLYIEDFTISQGETCTVSIMFDNEIAYTAFQCDIFIPDGLTATNFALTDRKSSNHTLSVSTLSDGIIRLMSYSLKLKSYSGNSGALVTFNLTASNTISGTASIFLRNVLLTTTDGVEVSCCDETCIVTIPMDQVRGDVNGDGSVNMDDLTTLINYLVFGNTPINQMGAASCSDADDVTIVNMDDLTSLINFLVFSNWP